MNIKTPLYFLIAQKYELLAGFSAIISILIINYLEWSYIFSILVVFVSMLIIVGLKVRDKSFYFISLKRRKQKDEWIGSGYLDYKREENCYSISESESGYIYSKCLTWSDYSFSFKFKIIKHCLGFIVRAINLSNYVMMQIDMRTKGVRPHIRVNGGWHLWEAKDSKLVFHPRKELSLDHWYQCHISCVSRSIDIKIYTEDGKELIFDRKWDIPSGKLVFSFYGKSETDSTYEKTKVDIPFPINLEYGSMGFRNYGDEKALIKEVLIKKL